MLSPEKLRLEKVKQEGQLRIVSEGQQLKAAKKDLWIVMTDVSESLREFTIYHRRIAAVQAMICLGVFALLAALMREDYTWWGGFAAGAVAQLAKFRFLDIAVIRKIAVEQKDAAATQLKAMIPALVLFGLAVAVVYILRLNVFAMAAGIFLPRLILIADSYIRPNPFGNGGASPTTAEQALPKDDRPNAGDVPETEAKRA